MTDEKRAAIEADIALHRRDVLKSAVTRVLLSLAIIILLISATGSFIAARDSAHTQRSDHAVTFAQEKANTAILRSLAGSLQRHTQSLDAINANSKAIIRVQRDLDHKFVVVIAASCKAQPSPACTRLLHEVEQTDVH